MVKINYQTKPPCWDRLAEAFRVRWVSGVTVTYGSEIYTFDASLPSDVVAHELVHVEQQRHMSPDEYLEKFIADPSFRREKEKAAYLVHNEFLRATIEHEAELFTKLHRNLKSFAATIGCSIEEADSALNPIKRLLP